MTISVILNDVADLTNTVTAKNTINTNSNTITAAFTSALNIAGDTMSGPLDMNGQQILNLPQKNLQNLRKVKNLLRRKNLILTTLNQFQN